MAISVPGYPAEKSLVYKHEPALFILLALVSAVIWLTLLAVTFGTVLIWLLFGFVFYLFVQSGFIAYLRGTGVRITASQYPDLHVRIEECCRHLGMETPESFLIHGNGVFNALATRFLGRDFIVLFSDIVDAMSDRPDALNFYIGHELGHIRRRHLRRAPWIWPAGLLPIIGAAYSRACEYTCDLHGTACCSSVEDARRGLAALAAGGQRWRTLDLSGYDRQVEATSGFWMSLHELIADYPWLVKRMRCLDPANSIAVPGRHPAAWLIALFVPRLGGGAALVVVALIGVLAAVAIPAYKDYTTRVQVTGALNSAAPYKACVSEHYERTGGAPNGGSDCGLDDILDTGSAKVRIVKAGVIEIVMSKEVTLSDSRTLLIEPSVTETGGLEWSCSGGDLNPRFRPPSCR